LALIEGSSIGDGQAQAIAAMAAISINALAMGEWAARLVIGNLSLSPHKAHSLAGN